MVSNLINTTTITTTSTTATNEVNLAFIPVAVLGGLSMTLSAVVVVYPAQRSARIGSEPSTTPTASATVANLILTGFGVVLSGVAIGMAPAAVAFAVSTGAYLLLNMILQTLLQIAKFSKHMVVGTFVLAAAITTLPQIGPTDPVGEVDVAALLTRFLSITFIVISLIGQTLAIFSIKQKYLRENGAILVAYAVIGGVGTVLNNCIVKLAFTIGLRCFADWLRFIPFICAYVVEAVICLGSAILANGTLEDPSAFVPITAGVNLVMQCLAGLFIWQDGVRIEHPLVYGMIYFLILLGIYDISTFDFLGGRAVQDAAQGVTSLTSHLGIRTIM